MTTYNSLDAACEALKSTLTNLQSTMKEARQMVSNETQWIRNEVFANELLAKSGYQPEDLRTLNQWGVLDAPDEDKVREIIAEVIDYRRDAMLHYTGESNF